MMNVLLVTTDAGHGAGGVLGAMRLYEGLKGLGHNCRIMAGKVSSPNPDFAPIRHNTWIEKALNRINVPLGLQYLHHYTTFQLPSHAFFQTAEVVNYHTVHGGYFNYAAFPKLTKRKPAVFTLHDMWAITGHCSFSYECNRWRTGCGQCPHPEVHPAIRMDNTALEFKIKRWAFQHSVMHIVSPSRWLADLARQSPILGHLPVHHVANGINLQVYKPLDQTEVRKALGIPLDKKVLLYTSYDLMRFVKGGDLLIRALNQLPENLQKDCLLLLMGHNGDQFAERVHMQTMDIGFLTGDNLKAAIFSAADLFVFPTRADNLPYVAMESIACGTPVASFDVGGMADMVIPGETGVLAKELDTEDLAQQVSQLLTDSQTLQAMRPRCRSLAEREFSIELQVEHYADVFRQVQSMA